MIDERIKELRDWPGKMLSQLRTLIERADPEVVEEEKWRGFQCGPTPHRASSPRASITTPIDFREGEKLDERALKALVRVDRREGVGRRRADAVI